MHRPNLSEFAFTGLGLNPHFGTPRNPALPPADDRVCGGSSSGAAAAVALGLCDLEALVGHKLFERTPRSIALTTAGARLYPVVRDSFDRVTAGSTAPEPVPKQRA